MSRSKNQALELTQHQRSCREGWRTCWTCCQAPPWTTLQQPLIATTYLLENLGFIVHPDKSEVRPTQDLEFLGMVVNTVNMTLQVPGEKLKKIRQEAQSLLNKGKVTASTVSRGHKKLVDVVLREKHLSKSPAPPRRGQCQSRSGVQGDERQVRLNAERLSLLKDPVQTGPGVGRPVCVPPYHAVGGLFQLETRSTSIGNRCDDARLDRVEGICQPPVGLDRQSSCQDSEGVCQKILLVVPVWPTQAWYPILLDLLIDYPRLIPPQENLMLETVKGSLPDMVHPPSRVAYLKQKYCSENLSAEASSFLHASWRTKS